MKLTKAAAATGAVLALGVVDYATGYEVHFFVFYFIPIALVASRQGTLAGYAVSGLCAATWFMVDWLTHPYPSPWIGVWNAAARLVAFAGIAYLVGRIQGLLAAAHREVQTLRGFLPICAQCKKVRNDQGYWQQVEAYLAHHVPVTFTHGLCDECAATLLSELKKAAAE